MSNISDLRSGSDSRNAKKNTKAAWKITIRWLIVAMFLICIGIFIRLGYRYYFTGFDEYTIRKNSTTEMVPQKFLWDWMDLLIIPVILIVGGFLLNHSEEVVRREIADKQRDTDFTIAEDRIDEERKRTLDRQREESLEDYIDKMTELLLQHKLKNGNNKTVANVARAKTLATVRVLDGFRKGLVLKFLFDAGLINGEKPIINLQYADFSGTQYTNAYLGNANLTNVDFNNAKLIRVDLNNAILTGVVLKDADLSNGKIRSSKLESTIFEDTNIEGISVSDSFFINVTMKNTNLLSRNGYLSNSVWSNCTFESCVFKDFPLHNARMEKVIFKHHTINNAKFIKSSFIDIDFNGASFTDVEFSLSKFQPTNFSETDLYNVKFDNTQLAGVNFCNSKMNKVSFKNAEVHFEKKIGEEYPLPDSVFTGATLIDVDMTGVLITEDQLNQMVKREINPITPTPTTKNEGLFLKILNAIARLFRN
jgi:uncharacterized protein YjbI with pentapeptide repeats